MVLRNYLFFNENNDGKKKGRLEWLNLKLLGRNITQYPAYQVRDTVRDQGGTLPHTSCR